MSQELQTLPRHHIIGDEFPEPKLAIIKDKIIEGTPELPPEVEMSPEFEEQLAHISEAIDLFTRNELGLDVSSRLSTRNEIHIASEEDFRAYCQKHYPDNDPDGMKGLNIGRHIIIPVRDEAAMLHTITHEEMHAVSAVVWKLKYINTQRTSFKPKELKNGYHNANSNRSPAPLSAINEYITEKATQTVVADYWPKVGIDSKGIEGYVELMPVMDLAVHHAATRLGEDPEDLIQTLERGMLIGDNKMLRPILMTLGPEMAKALTHAETHGEGTKELAQKLGQLSVDQS